MFKNQFNTYAKSSLIKGLPLHKFKIDVMFNWPIPTSLKHLRGFLGFTSRRFINNYASIAYNLKDALTWNTKAQIAFRGLETSYYQCSSFSFTWFFKNSFYSIWCFWKWHRCSSYPRWSSSAFLCKKFCPKLKNSSTYVKELHAIAAARNGVTTY